MDRFSLVLVASLLLAPEARAGGALFGSVRSPDGTALSQLVLTLSGPAGSIRIVTGPEGRYHARDLAPGEYAMSVDAPGFALSPEARARVGESETRLDLVLAPARLREHVVVAATRTGAASSTLGVSATVLDRDAVTEREASSLLPMLQDIPGVNVARAGGVGLQGSAFLRGGESRYARILVDGVPVNQPGGLFDFGSALPLELERVEVVRGAASSLYGTDALAGVVQLVTHRAGPGEDPAFRAEADAGSFGWKRGQGGSSGRSGRFDWNVGLLRLETDNEQPNSAFSETAGAASLGMGGDGSGVRLIARFEDSSVGTPGQTAFGRPDLDASFERRDWVLGGSWRQARQGFAHEARIGLARTRQLSLNPLDSGSFVPQLGDRVGSFPVADLPEPAGFQNDSDRLSVGYQAEVQMGSRHLLTVGGDLERETGTLGSRREAPLRPERTNVGAYVQDRVVFGERVYLTIGGRLERNDSFGTRAVPRAALAWRVRGGEDATTLRASGGAGIKEPDFFQSFGASFFAQGNPDLEPERSRTFDAGIEQRLLGGRLRAEAVFFHHDYLDQIAFTLLDFTTFQGTYVNLGKTRARGLELAVEATPTPRLTLQARYTLLDGEVLVSVADFDPVYAVGRPLLRRPKHQASVSARWASPRAALAGTLLAVGRRADSDFLGLGLTESERYVRLDARARVKIARGFSAIAVAENLLDRQYQEVLGYPALGRSLRLGVRFLSGEQD
jgi:vitamin B12 transporter